ncbi:MAG: metal ABC transporter substrate-binding protein [Candidatus Bathyarchaeia archaeon]
MSNKVSKIFLALLLALTSSTIGLHIKPSLAEEKPVIVCTTNVLGSIVKDFMGENASITVLVNPSLCPADYDMKPGDIYALSIAKIFFYHDIPGEKPWLEKLINASGNENLKKIRVPGTYNTPEGAKNCIRVIGGNLSEILSIDLSNKIEEMLAEIDRVTNEIRNKAQSLGVSSINVICMKWQKTFVEWVGFRVIATFDPPETLSVSDIENLVNAARNNNVALIIDNLQVSTEFGASIASETGAVHVILTNFPGAIPETENLAEMFRYNAERLFDGLMRWRIIRETETLKAENENLKNQVTIYQGLFVAMAVLAIAESIILIVRRKTF